MESFESTVLPKYRDKIDPDFRINNNLTLFYGQYPHCVHIHHSDAHDPELRSDLAFQKRMRDLKRKLKKIFTPANVATRLEWHNFRIYTKDIEAVLKVIDDTTGTIGDKTAINYVCLVDIMSAETLAHLKSQVTDSFKSVNKLCKKLPYNKYRYKIFWAAQFPDKRKIGEENLAAISMQLRHYDQVRFTTSLAYELGRMTSTSWHSTYFYAEDLNWISMINLIDHRFIKKIEVYKTEKEIE